MKKLLLTTLIATTALFAEAPMLPATPFASVAPLIGKGKPIFLEVGSKMCHSCQIMDRMLYVVKKEHPDYPLYFIDVQQERQAALTLKVQMIPTQIVFDGNGKAVFRHVGGLSREELDKVLGTYGVK